MEIAIEAYDVSSTPRIQAIEPDAILDEENPVYAPRMKKGNRRTLLDFSIDVKYIYSRFIEDLHGKHGPKRVNRFITWLKVGFIEQFHTEHRYQIKEDRLRLQSLINDYKSMFHHHVS